MIERFILDCDPGHDNAKAKAKAKAIIAAAGEPRVELVATTGCAGNQTIEKIIVNALAICAIVKIDVPVANGAGGPVMPSTRREVDHQHAIELIIDEVKEVVLAGCAFMRGDRTPSAGFDPLVDPMAAQALCSSSLKVTKVGHDLTRQGVATPDITERIKMVDSPRSDFIVDMLTFFAAPYPEHQGVEVPAVHDLCRMANIVDPLVPATREALVAMRLDEARLWDMMNDIVATVSARTEAVAR